MAQQQHNSLTQQIRNFLPQVLPAFLTRQRWFGGKARAIRAAEVLDVIPIEGSSREAFVVLARLKYSEGRGDVYAVPLVRAPDESASQPDGAETLPRLVLRGEDHQEGPVFHDALADEQFASVLLDAIASDRDFGGQAGEIKTWSTQSFRGWKLANSDLRPSLMRAEQSNTSIRFGDRLILKFYRRLEEGINPDLEIGIFLADKAAFPHTPPLAGALEYRRAGGPTMTLGTLQAFVPNQGDAWRYTLATLDSFLEKIALSASVTEKPTSSLRGVAELREARTPPDVPATIGEYWYSAGLLGRRTAQLHLALASNSEDPSFRPEPFSPSFQQSQHRSMRDLASHVLRTLKRRLESVPDSTRGKAETVLKREKELLERFDSFAQHKMAGKLIRIHGDYHLGQVLYTGLDFVIIDFEGEPARSLEERRAKRCPLQDVAGMLRSFHYAAHTALAKQTFGLSPSEAVGDKLAAWADYWQSWVSARFLSEYLNLASQADFLPASEGELSLLLDAYLLDKACYELGYELNNRPDWVKLPLEGILQLLGEDAA
jgi:trehalose synthase-fused probable maltokinase